MSVCHPDSCTIFVPQRNSHQGAALWENSSSVCRPGPCAGKTSGGRSCCPQQVWSACRWNKLRQKKICWPAGDYSRRITELWIHHCVIRECQNPGWHHPRFARRACRRLFSCRKRTTFPKDPAKLGRGHEWPSCSDEKVQGRPSRSHTGDSGHSRVHWIFVLQCPFPAYFLLGLSNNAINTLQLIQQDRGELRIGRDEQPIFHRFTRTEAAAVWYVRMACEVLGPRGDEKSGCRDAWLAFCSISGSPSRVTSFKSNRFNNLFEAAAALHFHRASIIDFLDNFLPEKNQKLESVLYDAKSDAVGVYVLTLAMVFFRITGPYWQLLGTKTHYLDFFQQVVALRAQLQEWTTEADSIFTPDLPSLFEKPPTDVDMFGAALAVPQDVKAKVTDVFAKLCGGLLVVVDTQLWTPSWLISCQEDSTTMFKIWLWGRNWHIHKLQIW